MKFLNVIGHRVWNYISLSPVPCGIFTFFETLLIHFNFSLIRACFIYFVVFLSNFVYMIL